MDAHAPALSREDAVRTKTRKVGTFSRYARLVCSAAFGFGLVGSVVVLIIGVMSLIVPGGQVEQGLTPQQKMWALPFFALASSAWLAAVYQLYRLFGNLSSGAIYTAENVRRVRLVGVFWLLSAVVNLLLPIVWVALIRLGAVTPAAVPNYQTWFSWSDSLAGFASAGLVVLISWVMDIGLYEKDQAEALQRDADLVI